MALFSVPNIKLSGVSASLPKQKESNQNLDGLSDEERTALIFGTGIENRRIADENTLASDLCVDAAQSLIDEMGWNKDEIEVLVFVTQTPDYLIPATANLIQHKLGLSKKCMSIDVTQGCSGYVYGLSVISSLMSVGKIKKGLLLVGDTITKTLKKGDNSTIPIFSDAGSATAIEYDDNATPIHFNIQSDGSGYETIIDRSTGYRTNEGEGLEMNGHNVLTFSLREVVPNISDLLSFSSKDASEIDYFVFHQANKLLNESIRKKLNVEKDKTPLTLGDYGNTSCTTIPLTIVSKLQDQMKKNNTVLLSGFGVGLSWGSAIIQSEGVICPAVREL